MISHINFENGKSHQFLKYTQSFHTELFLDPFLSAQATKVDKGNKQFYILRV